MQSELTACDKSLLWRKYRVFKSAERCETCNLEVNVISLKQVIISVCGPRMIRHPVGCYQCEKRKTRDFTNTLTFRDATGEEKHPILAGENARVRK